MAHGYGYGYGGGLLNALYLCLCLNFLAQATRPYPTGVGGSASGDELPLVACATMEREVLAPGARPTAPV